MCISLRLRLWGSRLLALALPAPPTDFHVLGEMYLQNIKCLAGLRLKLLGQHYIASVTIIILESVFITRSNLMGEACATLGRDAVHRACEQRVVFQMQHGQWRPVRGQRAASCGTEWSCVWLDHRPVSRVFSRGEFTTFYVIFYFTHT